jgi:hypothetical protein
VSPLKGTVPGTPVTKNLLGFCHSGGIIPGLGIFEIQFPLSNFEFIDLVFVIGIFDIKMIRFAYWTYHGVLLSKMTSKAAEVSPDGRSKLPLRTHLQETI